MSFKVGIEAEGIYKGLKTLFVIGMEPWNTVLEKAEQEKVSQVYLGADKSSVMSMLSSFERSYCSRFIITAEIELRYTELIPINTLNNVRFIVRVEGNIDFLSDMDMIKVDTGSNCYVTTKSQMIKNEINYLDKAL